MGAAGGEDHTEGRHVDRLSLLDCYSGDGDESEADAEVAVKEAAYRDALTVGAPLAECHALMAAAAEARRRRFLAEEAERDE